jgi:hypothetical protein
MTTLLKTKRTLRRAVACAIFAAAAAWSILAFIENREQEWAQDAQENLVPFNPLAHSAVSVENVFAGPR